MPGSWTDPFTTDYAASGRYTVRSGIDGTTFTIGGGQLLTGLPPSQPGPNVDLIDPTFGWVGTQFAPFCATLSVQPIGATWTQLSLNSGIGITIGIDDLIFDSHECFIEAWGDGTWLFRVVAGSPIGSPFVQQFLTLSGPLQIALTVLPAGGGAWIQTATIIGSGGATLTQTVPAAIIAAQASTMNPRLIVDGFVSGPAIGSQISVSQWSYSSCLTPGTIDAVPGLQGIRRRGRIVGTRR